MREPKSQNRNNREYTYEERNVEVPNEESSSTSNGVDKSTSQKEVLSYPLAKLLKGARKSYDRNNNLWDDRRIFFVLSKLFGKNSKYKETGLIKASIYNELRNLYSVSS